MWKEVGTWTAAPAMTAGSLASLNDLHVWLGLKNSDDQGTYFDLRVEAYHNSTLVASGQSLCITGVTRNPASAKEVVLAFAPFSAATFNGTSDVLNLKVLTRVGTNAAGASCGGHSNAVGLRLYFDAVARPSRFNATQGASDTTPPTVTVQQPAVGAITSATQVAVAGTYSDESQTTITVNGVAAVLSGANFSATVPLTEGANTLTVHAVDAAGNASDAARTITRDTTLPTLSVQQPSDNSVTNSTQVVVSGTFSDATATTITVNNEVATLTGNNFSAIVPLVDGPNQLNVVAVDAAANQSTASRSITRDTTAPTIAISQPADGAITNNTQVTVTGTFSDATATTIKVNGIAATLSGNNFTAVVSLSEGSNALHAVAIDAAQNTNEATRGITLDTIAPVLTIQSPADETLTADIEAVVSGTFSDASSVTVTVNNVAAALTQNSFSATVPLIDGPSLLIATAVDAAGNETEVERKITKAAALTLNVQEPLEGQLADSGEIRVAGTVTGTDVQVTVNDLPVSMVGGIAFGGYTALSEGTHTVRIKATDVLGRTEEMVRSVTVDTTPPTITEVLPASNQLVTETSTTVSGSISDATAITVTVNDVDASVGPDGVFTLANFTVSEGANAVRVEAIDALGNNTIADSVFFGKDRTAPVTPALFPVLAETKLQVQQVEGRAEPGSVVNITGGAEAVTTDAADGTGLFFATVNLAVGNNVLTVASVDKEGNTSPPVSLAINSDPDLTRPPGQPFQISISTNDAQKGLVGQELPRPLIARVTDAAGDPVAGVQVTFTNTFGGGHFVGSAGEFVAATDDEGRASARYIGTQTGFQYIMANFAGNPTQPISFAAELLNQIPGGETTASGVVLDQNLRALPNVLVRLAGQQTRTGSDGRFKLANVAFGPHQILELIGRDQIPFPGRWPNISYDFDVLPGVENHLGRPLFLPRVNGGVQMPLDANNVITTDTVYDLPAVGGLAPIRVTARAGTHVQFPPDVTDRRLSVTRIPVNRTPMILEDGMATNLYISVQPSGAIFDAPLELSFPNLDNLPANSEVALMSFDHDAGRYVKMGTGHVSADGSVVRSDPGSGIRVGAWQALPARPPGGGGGPRPATATVLSHVQVEGNPAFEGKDVEIREAVLESVRGVPVSENNANGVLKKVALRFLIPKLSNDPPKLGAAEVTAGAAKPEVEIDAGAFDFTTKELFIAEDKEIKLMATAKNALPDSIYKIKCSKPDEKKVTVVCNDNTNSITIKGSKVYVQNGSNYDFNAGETSFEIEMIGTLGGNTTTPAPNAKKAKIKVSLVRVRYKEDQAASGFDDLVKGKIQDATKVKFDAQGRFIGDEFKDDDPNNKLNKTKDPWLTTVLDVNQGNQTAKYEVKPDKAAEHIKFESDDVAKADVTADTANKKVTVTGKSSTGANQSNADETFVKAKLDSYKAETFEVGKLNVVVRKRVQVKTAFYYLRDTQGHHAVLDPDDLADYVNKINEILRPQTGVEYVIFRVYHWEAAKNVNFTPTATNNPAQLKKDFTSVVSYDNWTEIATGKIPPANTVSTQPKLCDVDVDREVYFVWDVEPTEAPGTTVFVRGAWDPATRTIIADDKVVDTLAHEIGHSVFIAPSDAQYRYFNCTHTPGTPCAPDSQHSNVLRELMFAVGMTTRGRYIPKADVDVSVRNPDWIRGGLRKLSCP